MNAAIQKLQAAYAWLTKNPNRVVLYLTTAANIATALIAVAADLDLQQVVVVLGTVVSVDAKVLTWVKGWQGNVEQPSIHARLIAQQRAAEADLVKQATAQQPPARKLGLPR